MKSIQIICDIKKILLEYVTYQFLNVTNFIQKIFFENIFIV